MKNDLLFLPNGPLMGCFFSFFLDIRFMICVCMTGAGSLLIMTLLINSKFGLRE